MSNPFEPSPNPGESGKPVHPLERRPDPFPPQQPMPPSRPPERPGTRRVAIPHSQPILAYIFLALNVLIFVADRFFLQYTVYDAANNQYFIHYLLTDWGVKSNELIMAGQLWRFITPVFLHADLIHLGVNSYSLYILGPSVERSYGHTRFAIIYLLSGFAGVIASFALSPYNSLGASGAIYGLFGALLPHLYRNRTILQDTQRRLTSLAWVIGVNLLISLSPGIDGWGHVGGLVGGLALGWFMTPLYKVVSDYTGQPEVKDGSTGGLVWGSAALIGVVMGGIAYLAMLIR